MAGELSCKSLVKMVLLLVKAGKAGLLPSFRALLAQSFLLFSLYFKVINESLSIASNYWSLENIGLII